MSKLILEHDWSAFVTLEKEKLLLAKREHWITLIGPIFLICFLSLFFFLTAVILFYVYSSILIFGILCAIILLLNLTLISKILIEWAFHLYIITNRKILELRHSPFTETILNDIMLDQVKCTEIDVHTNGPMEQLLDVGDIGVTFDRPTHQQEFMIRNIQHYQKVGALLRDELITNHDKEGEKSRWFRSPAASGSALTIVEDKIKE